MNQNMMNQQPNFGIEDTSAIECEKCNNNVFNNAFMFRRVSKYWREQIKTHWYQSKFQCVQNALIQFKNYYQKN